MRGEKRDPVDDSHLQTVRNCGCKSIKLQTRKSVIPNLIVSTTGKIRIRNYCKFTLELKDPSLRMTLRFSFLHMCPAVYHMTVLLKRSFQMMRSMIQGFKNELRINPVIKTVALIEVDWSRWAPQNLVGWWLIVILLIQQWSHTPKCYKSFPQSYMMVLLWTNGRELSTTQNRIQQVYTFAARSLRLTLILT